MRTSVFLVGIVLMILGPLITLTALSSCLGTILSGHFLACVTDFGFIILGSVVFLVGIIAAIVGALVSDTPPSPPPYPMTVVTPKPAQFTCKKCGRVYPSDHFFCPSCGQRPT